MQTPIIRQQKFCGRDFTEEEIVLARNVISDCGGISRRELAFTICELLQWKRPGGGLKTRECRDFLELLENKGILNLPEKKHSRKNRIRRYAGNLQCRQPFSTITGRVENITPLDVRRVETREQRDFFRDLVNRYHYLGYSMPYGARIQYLVYATRPRREVVGCVQFSSPAWRMKARDQWIGWDDEQRRVALQQVVNNSRFLILAPVRNLASTILSRTMGSLRSDWKRQYGLSPLLVETLVDQERFHGGAYRAANWIMLGETSGRGRMDRKHKHHGAHVKTVLVYPLVKNAVRRLREGR